MPIDYRSMVQQLMGLVGGQNYLVPVADKFNPLSEQMNPLATTEGARGHSGGAGQVVRLGDPAMTRLAKEILQSPEFKYRMAVKEQQRNKKPDPLYADDAMTRLARQLIEDMKAGGK